MMRVVNPWSRIFPEGHIREMGGWGGGVPGHLPTGGNRETDSANGWQAGDLTAEYIPPVQFRNEFRFSIFSGFFFAGVSGKVGFRLGIGGGAP